VAKYAALTVRKLKPGTYDEWRQAWKADPWPQGVHAYILRNLDDSNEIIAFGLTDRDADELRSDPQLQQQQRERQDAMAPFVESIGADGFYEVIDEVTG
jgi:hypothetical protein